jgi:lysophospholipase L1-like esterase
VRVQQQGSALEGFSDMTNDARSAAAFGSRWSLRFALSGLLLCCGAAAFAATGDGTLTDPNLTFVGRWDKSSSTQYTSHWDGAYVTTRFTGRNVTVNFAAPVDFKAVIDGKISTYWKWGTNTTYRLDTSALTHDGPHTLQIVAHYDNVELPFVNLVLDPSATTLPVEPRPHIEFIGDSITAGQGGSHWALTDYAWLTAETLAAHHTQIAWAGITLTDGYNYSNNWPGMESMYFRAWAVNRCSNVQCTPDANNPLPNPAWDFTKYSPKIIVVNLGTNDWALNEPGATFQDRYTTFLANVRAKHPAAEIFVLRTFNGYLETETKQAVAARLNAGDAKLHYVDTTGWLIMHPSADFADGFHPNDNGYQKVRDRLVPILQPYLANVSTLNDTQFTYDSTGNWPSGWQSGAYQNDNHWSNMTGAFYQVPFSGTQVKLYGAKAAWHGIAAVSIDNGPETMVDTYSATRADNVLLWSSPALTAGNHTLKVRVTGQRSASATGTYVVADRVDVTSGAVNLLSNAGFESGLNGWTVVAPAGTTYSTTNTASPNSGTSQLVHAGTAANWWVATLQTVTGLSNGLYTAKAWVRGTGGHQLYVKNFGGTDTLTATTQASSAYTQIVISNINVTNGTAEIGFWSNDPVGGGWLNVDDVTFYKQ